MMGLRRKHRIAILLTAILLLAALGCQQDEDDGDEEETGNERPVAEIVVINPTPALFGETVSFEGDGHDPDGYVTQFEWGSSLDGVIGKEQAFSTDTLSQGKHTIYLKVKDDSKIWHDEKTWSDKVTAELDILAP